MLIVLIISILLLQSRLVIMSFSSESSVIYCTLILYSKKPRYSPFVTLFDAITEVFVVCQFSRVHSISTVVSFNTSSSIQGDPPPNMRVAIFALPIPPIPEEDAMMSFILASQKASKAPYQSVRIDFEFRNRQRPHLPVFDFHSRSPRPNYELLWTLQLLVGQCLARKLWRPFKYELFSDGTLLATGQFSRTRISTANVDDGSFLDPGRPQATATRSLSLSYPVKPYLTSRSPIDTSRQLASPTDGNITNDISPMGRTKDLSQNNNSLSDDHDVSFTYRFQYPTVEVSHLEAFGVILLGILWFAAFDKWKIWVDEATFNFASLALIVGPVLDKGRSGLVIGDLVDAVTYLASTMYQEDEYAAMQVYIGAGKKDIGIVQVAEIK